MRGPVRSAVALVLLAAAACTTSTPEPGPPATSGPSPTTGSPTPPTSGTTGAPAREFVVPPPTAGEQSAAAVRTRLCVRPPSPTPSPAAAGTTPFAISKVEDEVQQVRGLNYEHPVAIDAVTHDQLVAGLDSYFDHSFPSGMLGRRSLAWSTIGVIPDGTSIRAADHEFQSSQVIGYYDPSTGQLVFIGTQDPSPFERYILAHELTHADDDQHFDLERLNVLEDACHDEGLMAATGAAEGSAVYFSQQVLLKFFDSGDRNQVFLQGGSRPNGVPPFVYDLATWPYIDGPDFIDALRSRGGLQEVNAALREFPSSTEQIIHPDRFPDDRPVAVDVPDLGPALGDGWRDLDVMDTGEEWIRAALDLRVPADGAAAAEGWGGAQYRAWTDGTHVAVVLQTAWDTPRDATEFLGTMRDWIGGRDDAGVGAVAGDPTGVLALFGSDAATLHRLEASLR